MILTALNKTWSQLLHPTFRSVFISSLLAALLTLVAISYLTIEFWPESWTTDIGFVDGFSRGLAVTIAWYLLFPPLVTSVSGLFTDRIAHAVEIEHYPHRLAARRVSIAEMVGGSIKLGLLIIIFNLLALPLYITFGVLSIGIGTLALYLILNGYLLGREYFDMVTIRHVPAHQSKRLRKTFRQPAMLCGMVTAGLFLIPVVNLLAPIIGSAMMTHIFHLHGIKIGMNLPVTEQTRKGGRI